MTSSLLKRLKQIYVRLPIFRELNLTMLAARVSSDFQKRIVETQQHLVSSLLYTNHPHFQDQKRLLRFSWQVNSQSSEDGIIDDIFHRIGTRNRCFAEVGIGDGKENNTAFLLTQGWRGAWIDGDPAFQETLAKKSGEFRARLSFLCTFVTRENITPLLDQLQLPKDLDFLSLDVDQNTY